jgi:hypothetical protein
MRTTVTGRYTPRRPSVGLLRLSIAANALTSTMPPYSTVTLALPCHFNRLQAE